MATVLKTRSGDGLLFVDDYGGIHVTSVKWLLGFISGEVGRGVLFLKELKHGTSPDRFRRRVEMNGDDDIMGHKHYDERAAGQDEVVRDVGVW